MITKIVIYADRVRKRLAAKRRRILFKQGGYLKRAMQRSMRYRRGPSKPGQPPSAHRETGAHLRQRIRFEVDLQNGSVICVPDLKPGSSVLSTKPLPQLLDQGGVAEGIGGEPIQIAARPFTAPTFTDGGKRFRELIEKEQL